MLSRICYAITHAKQHKPQLKKYLLVADLQLPSVLSLSSNDIISLGIKVLVLDFDGVLAAHAEPVPRADVANWLLKFQQEFAPRQIFILSNKPTVERQAYFSSKFPNIKFVAAKRKKPYPDGLLQIVQESGVQPEEVLLVDDRLTTGILAVILSGVRGCWITKPYVNLVSSPICETYFMGLRWLEKLFVKI